VEMHRQVIHDPKYGVPVLIDEKYLLKPGTKEYKLVESQVLDELFSHRTTYKDDEEMQEFFKGLIHVKYDYTRDGDLLVDQPVPDVPLYLLPSRILSDQKIPITKSSLAFYIQQAEVKNLPLVLNCGSWT